MPSWLKGTPPQDHTAPVEPVPENVVGHVFPYRGMEDHGIEPRYKNVDVPSNEGTVSAEFEPEKAEPDPIPVRIVSQGAKELRRWTTHYVMAGTNPSLMLSRREDRITARLKNTGSVPILLAPENSISVATGYPLNPGETFTTDGEAEVWGIVQAAGVGSPASGWVNLFPRQTVTGTNTLFGPPVPVRGATSIRFVQRIYAVGGTTIATKGALYAVNQDGGSIVGNQLATTPVIGVVTSMTGLLNPVTEDYIQGAVSNSGSSGDATVDTDVWGYIMPDFGTRDASQALVLVYQEVTVKE